MVQERTAWALVVCIPAAALLVCGGVWVVCPSPSIATGDPLLDAFFTEQLRGPLVGARLLDEDAQLPDSTFERLEDEFSADPRFWVLRYYFSSNEGEIVGASPIIDRFAWRESILDQAIAAGSADGSVLYHKLLLRHLDWYSEAKAECGMPMPGRNESHVEYDIAVRRVIDTLHGAEEEALLARLSEAEPEQALPHYIHANIESERGNYDTAIEYFKRGNRAPLNDDLIGFSFQWLIHDLSSKESQVDPLLSGALYKWHTVGIPARNLLRMKYSLRSMAAEAVRRRDRAGLQALHEYACVLGSTDSVLPLQATIAVVLVGVVRGEVSASAELTADSEMAAKVQAIRSQCATTISIIRNQPSMQALPTSCAPNGGGICRLVEDAFAAGRLAKVRELLDYRDVGLAVVKSSTGELDQAFQALRKLGYL